jgi:hypothetical protein
VKQVRSLGFASDRPGPEAVDLDASAHGLESDSAGANILAFYREVMLER